jgi:16S rRNA (guanine966-N2)-methyltransferase
MKERVREAVFNLIGPAVRGKHALDLFAGTGALGLEAISRGAACATFIERHFPTAELIRRNVATLGVENRAHVEPGDAFLWPRRQRDWSALSDPAWLILCSPPYDFYTERTGDMIRLIRELCDRAPADSLCVVEADGRFDFDLLADMGDWDIRAYPPAVLGVLEVR